MIRRALAAAGFLGFIFAGEAGAQIASHRAAYTLTLGGARSATGVASLEGAMAFEWQETCDGWTLTQRMSFRILDGEGNAIQNEVNFSSFEGRDGRTYRFTVRSLSDGEVTEQLRGRAELGGPGIGGRALFAEPEGESVELQPGTIFPTEHSRVLIERAIAGDRTVSRVVFDGATQDGAFDTNALIGTAVVSPAPSGPDIDANLLRGRSWRVRIAYFRVGDTQSEPDYEVSMRMFENGVGVDFLFDYGEFSIRAVLQRLEALPRPEC